ncbi:MAG: hypothetical protein ACI31G_03465 [Bacilli bacterium]
MIKNMDFYNEIKAYSQFIRNENGDSFVIFDGIGKVMVSCPHAVKQLRDGNIKNAEPETGIIGLFLNKQKQVPLILKTYFKNDDANYDEKSDYKYSLINYINFKKISCLLDLHMLSSTREVEINLGTANYNNFPNKELVNKIINIFKSNGFLNISVDVPYGAFYPFTVSSYIHSNTNIDCLQIEMNSSLLFNENDDSYKTTKIKNMINAFEKVIDLLRVHYERN